MRTKVIDDSFCPAQQPRLAAVLRERFRPLRDVARIEVPLAPLVKLAGRHGAELNCSARGLCIFASANRDATQVRLATSNVDEIELVIAHAISLDEADVQ